MARKILFHEEPTIKVQWYGREVELDRPSAKVHLAGTSFYQTYRFHYEKHRLAVTKAQNLSEEQIDAMSAEELSKMIGEVLTQPQLDFMLQDIADHIIAIDGDPFTDFIDGDEVTAEEVGKAINNAAAIIVLWSGWHHGQELTAEEKKSSEL